MILNRLLDEAARDTFLREHFLRLPFAQPGGARDFVDLASWEVVERLVCRTDADVLIVRSGERWSEERRPTAGEARSLFAEGYTLLVRHAERHDPALAKLAEEFRDAFHGVIDVHIYATPARQFGFGWHYDAEDVFILQAAGVKEYSLRKNTVNPWPLIETLPRDMRYEREIMPMFKCRLEAGDWLYIPHGYWHAAEAPAESISISVGVMPATGVDAFDFLRPELLESIRWRQRLPATGGASPLSEEELIAEYRARFAELGAELARVLADENFARQFVDEWRARFSKDADPPAGGA